MLKIDNFKNVLSLLFVLKNEKKKLPSKIFNQMINQTNQENIKIWNKNIHYDFNADFKTNHNSYDHHQNPINSFGNGKTKSLRSSIKVIFYEDEIDKQPG